MSLGTESITFGAYVVCTGGTKVYLTLIKRTMLKPDRGSVIKHKTLPDEQNMFIMPRRLVLKELVFYWVEKSKKKLFIELINDVAYNEKSDNI
eukprot:snap_masked-scaffold_29-processed-gene-3.19-mRNA-1 protein AED:1.00 eAED:1.00 QI:0/0/0/0/1/1/2/0/92